MQFFYATRDLSEPRIHLIVKIFVLISIVIAGIAILFLRISGKDLFGFSNLYKLQEGFFHFGFSGVLQVLVVIATFAFIGVEFIDITAVEAKEPQQKTIPSTINKVIPSIALVYISIFVVQMKRRYFMSKKEIANLKYQMPFYLTNIQYSNILIFVILVTSTVSLVVDNRQDSMFI